jgi:glycosyltransferase involved in cell wall biosynthesis
MKVTFLLPTRSIRPAGGFKIVYEYANRLTARGHEVTVVHPFGCAPPPSAKERLKARIWVAKMRARPARIAPWFDFDEGVKLTAVTYPAAANLPTADVLVATAWHTAAWVDGAGADKGAGAYLIQGYETWDGEDESVHDTWRLPLRKIVISKWLEEIAVELGQGETTVRVPLGMDLERLGVDVPPADRAPRLGALYNSGKTKGSADIFATLKTVKAAHPEVSAVLFGTAPRPRELPRWVEYEMLPSAEELRALYNSCTVFLQASRSEGWGLPACEAMLCGSALVTVDNGGSREFALDRETALVVSADAVGDLPLCVGELLGDVELRLRLAEHGRERLQSFTWERSVGEFEGAIADLVEGGVPSA